MTYWPGSVSVTSPFPGAGTRWKSWICRSQENIPITAAVRQTTATASRPPASRYQYRDGRNGPVPVLGCCPAVGIMSHPRAIQRRCIPRTAIAPVGKALTDYTIWTPLRAVRLTDSLPELRKIHRPRAGYSDPAEERVRDRRRCVGADPAALDEHREGEVAAVPDEPGVGRRVPAGSVFGRAGLAVDPGREAHPGRGAAGDHRSHH